MIHYCEKWNHALTRGETVRVHFNLQKGNWTIAARVQGKGWRTVHNAPAVCLENCRAVISLSTLQRIRDNKRRKVCARIEGTLIGAYDSAALSDVSRMERVSFNPYRPGDTFTDSTGAPWVSSLGLMYFAPRRVNDVAPRGARCYCVKS